MSRVAICVVLLAWVSSASAKIIYEPIQYQYRSGDTTYYYGGSEPRVHLYAREPLNPHRQISTKPYRVYSEEWNYGLRDVRNLGYTPADAQNQANANAPRYFVMRDLLKSAVGVDGVWVVPAQAQPIRVYKSNGTLIERQPAKIPRPLMIIPKDALEKPLKQSDKQLAAAE